MPPITSINTAEQGADSTKLWAIFCWTKELFNFTFRVHNITFQFSWSLLHASYSLKDNKYSESCKYFKISEIFVQKKMLHKKCPPYSVTQRMLSSLHTRNVKIRDNGGWEAFFTLIRNFGSSKTLFGKKRGMAQSISITRKLIFISSLWLRNKN